MRREQLAINSVLLKQAALEAGGYDGFYSIEMFSDQLWAMPAERAAMRMYESLLPLTQ